MLGAARDAHRRSLIQGMLLIAGIILLCVGLSSCGEPDVRPPAAVAADLHQAAAQAEVDAAEAEAAAETAPASPEADALRVAAAKLRAKATALDELATKADQRAAEAERQAELRAWRTTCRWIALGSVLLGALIAAGGIYARASLVVGAGALVACVGLVAQAWGEALGVLTWLLPILAAAGVIAAVVISARRKDAAALLTGHLADAYEYGRDSLGRSAKEIKALLPIAQSRAGIKTLVDRARINRGLTPKKETP